MYSHTVSALTLLDWQQNWITLPNLSLSTCQKIFFNPTSSTSLAELQLLYFSSFSDLGILIFFLAMNWLLCTSTCRKKISYCSPRKLPSSWDQMERILGFLKEIIDNQREYTKHKQSFKEAGQRLMATLKNYRRLNKEIETLSIHLQHLHRVEHWKLQILLE